MSIKRYVFYPTTTDTKTYIVTFGLPSCPQLKQNREQERKDAIKNGFLADPDKPTSLAYAITPVGTCQDMCPEYERVERIVQLMVDGREKVCARKRVTVTGRMALMSGIDVTVVRLGYHGAF